MATTDTDPTINPATGQKWDVTSLLQKVIELQDQLVQAQEKNVLLSAQTRELERVARDSEDLKAEISNQSLLLADKTRENKQLHQDFSRLSTLAEAKMQEVEELQALLTEYQHQLKTRESERDLLAVMLNEAENAQRRVQEYEEQMQQQQGKPGWGGLFKPKST